MLGLNNRDLPASASGMLSLKVCASTSGHVWILKVSKHRLLKALKAVETLVRGSQLASLCLLLPGLCEVSACPTHCTVKFCLTMDENTRLGLETETTGQTILTSSRVLYLRCFVTVMKKLMGLTSLRPKW